jgi:hypothetical protein
VKLQSLVVLLLIGFPSLVVGVTASANCEDDLSSTVIQSKRTIPYDPNSYQAPILISKIGEDVVSTRGQETKLSLVLPPIVLKFLEMHPNMRPFWSIFLQFNLEWASGDSYNRIDLNVNYADEYFKSKWSLESDDVLKVQMGNGNHYRFKASEFDFYKSGNSVQALKIIFKHEKESAGNIRSRVTESLDAAKMSAVNSESFPVGIRFASETETWFYVPAQSRASSLDLARFVRSLFPSWY